MTERDATSRTQRRGRRSHPARNARLVSTGAAASLTLGVVAALAISDASAASRDSAAMIEQTATELAPVSTSATSTPATIMVIRRIHYLPAATVAPVSQAADEVVFSPQPAVRADTKTTAVSPKRTPARPARRATRAS